MPTRFTKEAGEFYAKKSLARSRADQKVYSLVRLEILAATFNWTVHAALRKVDGGCTHRRSGQNASEFVMVRKLKDRELKRWLRTI